jgi:hypothetical protein
MLTGVSHLKGFAIHASDGEIGHLEEFYFDDETWAIRYLIVNTGNWLSGRLVLISPAFLRQTDWDTRLLYLALTREKIKHSPDIDTHKPVSRQHEAEYLDYYGSSYYWGGFYPWGAEPPPSPLLHPPLTAAEKRKVAQREVEDSHLRSTAAVTGYRIEAADGDIGHVKDFIVSPDTWNIRYLEVDTHNWLPGRKVLVSPDWIVNVSWSDSKMETHLSREMIKSAPEYNDSIPITRDYENQIHVHYGRRPYWVRETESTLPMPVGR